MKSYIDSEYEDVGGRTTARNNPKRPCILIIQYQFLCRPIKDVDATNYNKIIVGDGKNNKNDSSKNTVSPNEGIGNPESVFHHRIFAFQTKTETKPLPISTVVFCKAPNFLCSRYGQRHYRCIAE